jgi:hypothetical protein
MSQCVGPSVGTVRKGVRRSARPPAEMPSYVFLRGS